MEKLPSKMKLSPATVADIVGIYDYGYGIESRCSLRRGPSDAIVSSCISDCIIDTWKFCNSADLSAVVTQSACEGLEGGQRGLPG